MVINRLIPEVHLHTAPSQEDQDSDEAEIAAAVGVALYARGQSR